MEVIYMDRLILLNLAADYLICLAAARVCGVTLRRLRYLAAAAIGAAYAGAVYLPGMELLASVPVKLGCALLMCAVAYGGEKKPWRCAAVFITVSAAFGGAVWALAAVGGSGAPLVSLPTLFIAFALCYAALTLVFYRRAGLMARRRAAVSVELRGRRAEFIALRDSGNALVDPLSGADVMIACPHALKPLFEEYTAVLCEDSAVELVQLAAALPELAGLFRLIPFSALGGGGLLAVFKPGRVTVDGGEERDLLIAVSANAAGDGFEAIL